MVAPKPLKPPKPPKLGALLAAGWPNAGVLAPLPKAGVLAPAPNAGALPKAGAVPRLANAGAMAPLSEAGTLAAVPKSGVLDAVVEPAPKPPKLPVLGAEPAVPNVGNEPAPNAGAVLAPKAGMLVPACAALLLLPNTMLVLLPPGALLAAALEPKANAVAAVGAAAGAEEAEAVRKAGTGNADVAGGLVLSGSVKGVAVPPVEPAGGEMDMLLSRLRPPALPCTVPHFLQEQQEYTLCCTSESKPRDQHFTSMTSRFFHSWQGNNVKSTSASLPAWRCPAPAKWFCQRPGMRSCRAPAPPQHPPLRRWRRGAGSWAA